MSKHFRLFAVTLPVLMVLGCAMSPQAKHDRALSRTKEFLQKKDYARALLECRTAVQTMPKDPEGYYELGLVYIRSQQLQNAVFSFRKALSLKPDYKDAQIQLASMMAATTDPAILKEAEHRMAEVVKEDPNNSEALNTLALAELKLGDTDDAIGQLQRALMASPQSLRSSILLAEAKLAQKDWKAAETVLQKACQDAPQSVDPLIILAEFYISRQQIPSAEQTLQQAIKLSPNNPAALLLLGKLQFSLGRKQQAEETFSRLSHLPDKAFAPLYGTVLFQEGRREEALREFQRLAQSDPNDRMARTRLVTAYWSSGRTQDAEQLLNAALSKNPNDNDALLQQAQILITKRNYIRAERNLNTVLHLNANSAEAHYLLSKVHAGKANSLLQSQELSEALRLAPTSLQIRLELARVLILTNGANSAQKLLDETPVFQKNSLPVVLVRNWTQLALGDMEAARKGIDVGLAQQRSPELLLQDSIWKLKQGKPDAARATLDEVLTLDPQNVQALNVLYAAYSTQHQNAAGIERVKHYAGKVPNAAPVQLLLAQLLIANGQNAEARSAFSAALAIDPRMQTAQTGLVELDVKEGNLDAAVERLKGILTTNSEDTRARLLLGNVEELKGDHASALGNYQQVAEAEPKNAEALNNLAYLLVDFKKQPDAALHYAEKARQIAPDNADYVDTVGWVLYQKGLYSVAVKDFETAASYPGSSPVCRYHLAMAYAKLGERDKGRTVLAAALKQNPKLPEASEATSLLAR